MSPNQCEESVPAAHAVTRDVLLDDSFCSVTRIFTDIEELGHVIAVKSKLLSYLR